MTMLSGNVPHTAQGSLRALGVSWQLIALPTPYLWLLPQTSDPDTAGVIEIIRALQRGLQRIGFGSVAESGTLDMPTKQALDRVAGNWQAKSWMQIINDVVFTMTDPERVNRLAKNLVGGLGDYIAYEPSPGEPYGAGPLPGLMVGTPPGPLGLGATESAGSLTWNSSGTSCTPVPRSSGSTYASFKNLQRQVNRLSSKFGGNQIAEDGIIGSGTVGALKKVVTSLGLTVASYSCGDIAGQSESLGSTLKGFADTMGIPAGANKPGGALASVPVFGKAFEPPSDADSEIVSSLKRYGPFFALAAGVAFIAAKYKKGSGSKGKKKGRA